VLIAIAIALIGLTWLSSARGWKRAEEISSVAFFVVLIVWLLTQADFLNLGSGEEGLLKWIGYGLVLALAAEILQRYPGQRIIAGAVVPLAAVLFALGLDVVRPSEYAYAPATILAILVALVAGRAAQRMLRDLKGRDNSGQGIAVLFYVSAMALLLFAAFFKLMDRNWLLPWSYLVSIGALLFAVSQLWMGWKRLFAKDVVEARHARAAYQLGMLLIVVSAFFHYQQYF
jgi:hypothetical protein